MTDLKSFNDVSLGLTFTDTLWVKEEHSDSKWKDVNRYDNEFNEIVSQNAFIECYERIHSKQNKQIA